MGGRQQGAEEGSGVFSRLFTHLRVSPYSAPMGAEPRIDKHATPECFPSPFVLRQDVTV